jgi:hypothetical protein
MTVTVIEKIGPQGPPGHDGAGGKDGLDAEEYLDELPRKLVKSGTPAEERLTVYNDLSQEVGGGGSSLCCCVCCGDDPKKIGAVSKMVLRWLELPGNDRKTAEVRTCDGNAVRGNAVGQKGNGGDYLKIYLYLELCDCILTTLGQGHCQSLCDVGRSCKEYVSKENQEQHVWTGYAVDTKNWYRSNTGGYQAKKG